MVARRVAEPTLGSVILRGLAFAIALASTATSEAQTLRLPTLEWTAPAGACPNRQEVMTTIARWLRQSAAPVDASRLHVAGNIEVVAGRYTLSLWLSSPSGRAHERFAAVGCSTLTEVVALKVALAATGMAVEPLPTATQVQQPPQLTLRLGGSLSVGHLPGVSPAASLALSWTAALLRLELALTYAPPRSVRYVAHPDAGVDIRLTSAAPRACLGMDVSGIYALTCSGIELGWMRGSGVNTIQKVHSDQLLASVVLGTALRVPVTPEIALWIELGAALAFVRPQAFYLRSRAVDSQFPDLYRSDFAAGRLSAGLELGFP